MCNHKECAICLEPMTSGNDKNVMIKKNHVIGKRNTNFNFVQLACGHTFHMKCLKELYFTINQDFFEDPIENPLFAEHTDKCPMCRESISVKSGKYHHIINTLWSERKMNLVYEHLECMGVSESEYFSDSESYDTESIDSETSSSSQVIWESDWDSEESAEFEETDPDCIHLIDDTMLWGEMNTTVGHLNMFH